MKKTNKILLILTSFFYILIFNLRPTILAPAHYNTEVKETLYGLSIKTIYGEVKLFQSDKHDNIMIQIIKCPAFKRMLGIHQYGTTHYVINQLEESPYKGNFQKDYTRWEHSLGVLALLRKYNAKPIEQIAGLIHDISHTGFSHVGDFLFKSKSDSSQTSFQDMNQKAFLEASEIKEILESNDLHVDDVLIDKFKNLKQSAPEICADNLEYTLKGGVLAGYLSINDIQPILEKLKLDTNSHQWFFTDQTAAFKFGMASLMISTKNSGSVWNAVLYTITAKIIKRAFKKNILSPGNFLYTFTTSSSLEDDVIFSKLKNCTESKIGAYMGCLSNFKKVYEILEFEQEDSIPVKTKFRGTNPCVLIGNEFRRLTDINADFQKIFDSTKTKHTNGNFIRFKNGFKILFHKIKVILGQ